MSNFSNFPNRMPLAEAASNWNLTVEAYKLKVVARWREPQAEAVAGVNGYGYRVVEHRSGMDWRIFFSDGDIVTLPRIVILLKGDY